MAISTLLLVGCASSPTTPYANQAPTDARQPVDLSRLPQMALPGATLPEVKALAMGAARSKGWTIGEASADRLIVQRPADTPYLASAAPGAASVLPGSTIEVTSFFTNTGGGVTVATMAEVVTPPLAGAPAARTDYTDAFRDSLMQSLDSLRDAWSRNQGRLSRAAPPSEGWRSAWDESSSGAPVSAPTDAPSSQPTAWADAAPETAPNRAPTSPPSSATNGANQPAKPQAPTAAPSTSNTASRSSGAVPIPTYNRTAPEPRYRSSSTVPVVDGSTAINGASRPAAPSTAVAQEPRWTAQDNMMSLPETPRRGAGSVAWSANAEQYARQRGCQVAPGGAQLIESRQDGEVHKIPCEGSDSFLVKCQNGTCQGLL
jgi:hypothetical protein